MAKLWKRPVLDCSNTNLITCAIYDLRKARSCDRGNTSLSTWGGQGRIWSETWIVQRFEGCGDHLYWAKVHEIRKKPLRFPYLRLDSECEQPFWTFEHPSPCTLKTSTKKLPMTWGTMGGDYIIISDFSALCEVTPEAENVVLCSR